MLKQIKTKGGKKIREARNACTTKKNYDLNEAIDILKGINFVKFNPTVDIAINLGIDTKHSDQMVRGITSLPFGTGKDVRVAVICKEERESEAKELGADIVGTQNLLSDIKSGKIDFDVCIATPDMMGIVGQVAKILGPKGLMPNPKLGTVTNDLSLAIKNAKSGQVEFRADKGGIIHAGVGKLSFNTQDLSANIMNLINAIKQSKPASSKGTYIKGIYISSTISPSLKIDTSNI